jgi:hypothetical protein
MRYWINRSALMVALVLTAAACAGDGGAIDTSTSTTASTVAPPATEATGSTGGEATSTTAPATEPPPQVEGPAAPDFVLALADGSSFSLSDEQKPVYLVFWAEW